MIVESALLGTGVPERVLAALLTEKRAAVVALRDEGTIDDIALTRVQRGLDAEEVRLARDEDPRD